MLLGNMIFGVVVSVFSAVLFFYLQGQSLHEFGQKISANVWPSTLSFILMIFGGIVAIQYAFRLTKIGIKEKRKASPESKKNILTFFTIILATIAYIISLKILGFIIATYLFLFVSFCIVGVKDKFKLFFLPFLMVCIFTVGFVMILYIPLPRGMGIFRTLFDFIQ